VNARPTAPPENLRKASEKRPRKNAPRPLRSSLRTPSENGASRNAKPRSGGGKTRIASTAAPTGLVPAFGKCRWRSFLGGIEWKLGCEEGVLGMGFGRGDVGVMGVGLGGVGEGSLGFVVEDVVGGGGGFGVGSGLVVGGGVGRGFGMVRVSGSDRIFGLVSEGIGGASRGSAGVGSRRFTEARGARRDRDRRGRRGPWRAGPCPSVFAGLRPDLPDDLRPQRSSSRGRCAHNASPAPRTNCPATSQHKGALRGRVPGGLWWAVGEPPVGAASRGAREVPPVLRVAVPRAPA
jgi:hypothetical protein